jgi:hypothetical protein
MRARRSERMSYRRRMKIGAVLGLVAAALLGAAITHDRIVGPALLLYPAGLLVGLAVAHMTAGPKIERSEGPTARPEHYYKASRRSEK